MSFQTSFGFVVKVLIILEIFVNCDDNVNNVQYRLPNNTIPLKYEIKISTRLDQDNFKFSGTCLITIKAVEESDSVVLHSYKAEISKVEVKSRTEAIGVEKFERNPFNDFLTIKLQKKLTVNETYQLEITYSSNLRDDKLGFYRFSYRKDDGQTTWIAATQFAPTQARHAFPCYDEPGRKATFQLEITHPSHLQAISNTETRSARSYEGLTTTTFLETNIMSTYLVGFVLSDFSMQTRPFILFPMQFYARSSSINYTEQAQNFTQGMWETFSATFLETFMPKVVKHVALPEFYFNGMENWGLITFKESRFVYDPEQHNTEHLMKLPFLICHEIAHSWFGNLVTMEWWNYVWLKEGFATFYSYYVPYYKWYNFSLMQLFIVDKMHNALRIDSKKSTRPMTHYVEKQDEIVLNYDKIAYDKAACVINMFNSVFGHSEFWIAINDYLRSKKYSSATESDLFMALEGRTEGILPPGINISDAFRTWTSQKGYPLITMTRNSNQASFEIKQEQFVTDGESDPAVLWHVPIAFQILIQDVNTDTKPSVWLKDRTAVISSTPEKSFTTTDCIILNTQQVGYYRVNYDLTSWEIIIKALVEDPVNIYRIHDNNRAQLIDDAFALASINKLNYSIALNLLQYMSRELQYAPWAAFDTGIKELRRNLLGSSSNENLSKFIRKLTQSVLSKIGLFAKSIDLPTERLLRRIVANHGCLSGVPRCNEDINFNSPDMRPIYYCNELRKKNKDIFDEMKRILKENDIGVVRNDVISAFGCSPDATFLNSILKLTTEYPSSLKLTPEERRAVLESIYSKGVMGLNLSLQFLSSEWTKVDKLLKNSSSVILAMSRYVNNDEMKNQLEGILRKPNISENVVKEAQSNIEKNYDWLRLHKDEVDSTLIKLLKSSSGRMSSLGSIAVTVLVALLITLQKIVI